MRKYLSILSCIIGLAFLSSCSTISSSDSNNASNDGDSLNSNSSTNIEYENTYRLNSKRFTIHDLMRAEGVSSTPTSGSATIIVVPVQFSDLTRFTSDDLYTINATFNGTKSDNSNSYWESVKSFYYKSSFHKLNLSFEIADVFTPTITSSRFKQYESSNASSGTYKIVEDFYKNGTINSSLIDWNSYDKDYDGYVDGIWFVYNEKDLTKGDSYWPYVYWYNQDVISNTGTTPIISNYANAAMSFMYEASSSGEDAHTFIHETGHLLGFDDYYSNDDITNNRNSLGGFDMQDLNIGDQGSYSKLLAGWISPIVVTGDTTITINSYSTSGDTILIPANLKSFNDSALNEYIILDLYTPEGLYEKDAYNMYTTRPTFYKNTGVRMYYVDSRVATDFTFRNGYARSFTYLDGSETSLTYYTNITHSNTLDYSYALDVDSSATNEFLYSFIAKGVNHNLYNYKNAYEYDYSTQSYAANEDYLFYEGDSFSIDQYSNLFSTGNKFHDGSKVNFTISIDKISNKQATISVKYN